MAAAMKDLVDAALVERAGFSTRMPLGDFLQRAPRAEAIP